MQHTVLAELGGDNPSQFEALLWNANGESGADTAALVAHYITQDYGQRNKRLEAWKNLVATTGIEKVQELMRLTGDLLVFCQNRNEKCFKELRSELISRLPDTFQLAFRRTTHGAEEQSEALFSLLEEWQNTNLLTAAYVEEMKELCEQISASSISTANNRAIQNVYSGDSVLDQQRVPADAGLQFTGDPSVGPRPSRPQNKSNEVNQRGQSPTSGIAQADAAVGAILSEIPAPIGQKQVERINQSNAQTTVWRIMLSKKSGKQYYFNTETQQSQYEVPSELRGAEGISLQRNSTNSTIPSLNQMNVPTPSSIPESTVRGQERVLQAYLPQSDQSLPGRGDVFISNDGKLWANKDVDFDEFEWRSNALKILEKRYPGSLSLWASQMSYRPPPMARPIQPVVQCTEPVHSPRNNEEHSRSAAPNVVALDAVNVETVLDSPASTVPAQPVESWPAVSFDQSSAARSSVPSDIKSDKATIRPFQIGIEGATQSKALLKQDFTFKPRDAREKHQRSDTVDDIEELVKNRKAEHTNAAHAEVASSTGAAQNIVSSAAGNCAESTLSSAIPPQPTPYYGAPPDGAAPPNFIYPIAWGNYLHCGMYPPSAPPFGMYPGAPPGGFVAHAGPGTGVLGPMGLPVGPVGGASPQYPNFGAFPYPPPGCFFPGWREVPTAPIPGPQPEITGSNAAASFLAALPKPPSSQEELDALHAAAGQVPAQGWSNNLGRATGWDRSVSAAQNASAERLQSNEAKQFADRPSSTNSSRQPTTASPSPAPSIRRGSDRTSPTPESETDPYGPSGGMTPVAVGKTIAERKEILASRRREKLQAKRRQAAASGATGIGSAPQRQNRSGDMDVSD